MRNGENMQDREAKVLILCKTYPSPSAKYQEISCVAGMEESGQLIRLYPVPFRLIDGEQKFSKWQWISAKVEKSQKDKRPESHKLLVGSIKPGAVISTDNSWANRRVFLDKLNVYENPEQLEVARQKHDVTIGLVRPHKILDLQLTEHANKEWTPEQREKLIRSQMALFDDEQEIGMLEKIPVDFHYHYECHTPTGLKKFKHKIQDWEAGALYRRMLKQHGSDGW